MTEDEARAVAHVLAEAFGGIYVVARLVARANKLLPEWDWEQLVADIDPTVVGPADYDRLRARWGELETLAASHGITALRWDGERLVGRFDTSVGLTDEFAFKAAAAHLVGRAVDITADEQASGKSS